MLINQKIRHSRKLFQCVFMYLSSTEQKIKRSFLNIVNLKGKTGAEIMDVIQKFIIGKSLRIDTVLFSDLDVRISMSGKKIKCREEYSTTLHATFTLTPEITVLLYVYQI